VTVSRQRTLIHPVESRSIFSAPRANVNAFSTANIADDSHWKISCSFQVVMRGDCTAENSNRFENKYALPENLAAQVLSHARLFLPADRGLERPQNVTTLYLDTADLTFYQWHKNRRIDRFKLRIRGYGQAPVETVYVEIKGRHGELVRKTRAEVTLSKLHEMLTGVRPAESSVLREFLRLHRTYDAGPKVIVRCMRTAFRDYNADGEVAVTADRGIVCQAVPGYELVDDPQKWTPVSLPGEPGEFSTIVEFKYAARPPEWMASLMSDLVKYRVRFSKYCAAMDQHIEWMEFLLERV
jgi:VTC domain-containing protein